MRLTERVHTYLSQHLQSRDHAIDATAGNGYDTAHMANLVGSEGCVVAMDIQKTAIDATRERLESLQCLKQVQLLNGDHSEILHSPCSTHAQKISAITFNLGYLPGSDKNIQTTPETTIRALNASRLLLKPDGILLVTAYREHEGGQFEADAVAEWMQQLKQSGWSLEHHDPATNGDKRPPILFIACHSSHIN